jgi:1-acyl-sn-glycerol-3-phosphate acyltransferase
MEKMDQELVQVADLRQSILNDVFKDFNDPRKKWVRSLLEPLVWFSAHRFAGMAANLDNTITQYGLRQALHEFAAPFVRDVIIEGYENIPQDGPLLIVSNHPGAIDGIAIGASLPRDDLNVMATGFPLLKRLPSASQRIIFIDPHAPTNLTGVRATISHLEAGGAVLIFPSGRVEPDPAILPNAREALQNWSPSIELFTRKVPETQVMVTIVSGVLAPVFLHNPLIRLWSGVRDPLMVAEVTQVITQMILKKRFRMTPRISFDIPHTVDELRREYDGVFESILDKASSLMSDHLPVNESNLKLA